MENLQTLNRRVAAAEELESVTHTMKGLAAVNVRQFERAARALDGYWRVIETGLHVALRFGGAPLPGEVVAPDAPAGVVIFGSDQGLCGPINRHVASHAQRSLAELPNVTERLAVGLRLASELEASGVEPTARTELPSSVDGITDAAQDLSMRIDEWRQEGHVARTLVVFPRFESRRGSYEPTTTQLVPIDPRWLAELAARPWPTRMIPMLAVPLPELMASLTKQYLFVQFHRSFAQTMASVAASRLAAMEGAQRNISERLDGLRQRRHQVRQAAITAELLDVVSGFEAISGDGG